MCIVGMVKLGSLFFNVRQTMFQSINYLAETPSTPSTFRTLIGLFIEIMNLYPVSIQITIK